MSFKRPTHLWAKNKEITDIQHQAQTDLTCLSASDVYNTPSTQRTACCVVLCSRSRIISTLHEDWQTDNKVWQGSMKHLGFTLISVT